MKKNRIVPVVSKCIFSLFALFTTQFSVSNAYSQTIVTIAGNGTLGYSGDGGPATTATLRYPWCLTIDAQSNIYFTDCSNSCVRKIDTAGIITTVAGTGVSGSSGDGGPATAAKFNGPTGIAVDKFGNIYIAENAGHRIRKINSSGIISTYAGTGISGYSGDGGAATNAQINNATEIAVDTFGNVYFPDQTENVIRSINTAGIINTIVGTGVGGYSGDGGAATLAQIQKPNDVFVDYYGNIFFTEYTNNTVRKVNTSGIVNTIAGMGTSGFSGDGGAATSALLFHPAGIDVNAAGDVFICDQDNNRVRKISVSGIITTIAGTGIGGYSGDNGPATAAQVKRPNKLIHDLDGNIIIADIDNDRVRAIINPNHIPLFTGGSDQSLTICQNETDSLKLILSVMDSDALQTENWDVVYNPSHGLLKAVYTIPSTGSLLVPSGLYYKASSSYIGADSFKVKISDGITSRTTTTHITIIGPCTTGIASNDNLKKNAAEIYPNPNNGSFILKLPEDINPSFANITIYNMVGVKIKQLGSADQEISIDVPTGIYFLQATTKETVYTKKFIIER